MNAIWGLFVESGRWPTFDRLARHLDRAYGVVLEDALPHVPLQLIHGVDTRVVPSGRQELALSAAGVATVDGADDEVIAFVLAVRAAADLDRVWDPPTESPDALPQLTSTNLPELLGPTHRGDAFVARVGSLLRVENWGWSSASGGDTDPNWSFSVSRQVRRYRDVRDIYEYLSRSASDGRAKTGPAGMAAIDERRTAVAVARNKSARSVFLVHGRDFASRDALVGLLRAFDLKVITWREAAAAVGGGTPYTGDIVRAGMDLADAVVVLLTPDDIGQVHPDFRQERDGLDELNPTGQARLNVIFEAGMAMMRDRDRVVLVEIGPTRSLSDTAGLNVIRMRNHIEARKDLASRLRSAGLEVDTDGEDWREAGNFDRPGRIFDSVPGIGNYAEDLAAIEMAVLRRIAEVFKDPGQHRLDTPFDVDGVAWPDVASVLQDLSDSTPPYIEGVKVDEEPYPVVITGLTVRGRRAMRKG